MKLTKEQQTAVCRMIEAIIGLDHKEIKHCDQESKVIHAIAKLGYLARVGMEKEYNKDVAGLFEDIVLFSVIEIGF